MLSSLVFRSFNVFTANNNGRKLVFKNNNNVLSPHLCVPTIHVRILDTRYSFAGTVVTLWPTYSTAQWIVIIIYLMNGKLLKFYYQKLIENFICHICYYQGIE